MLWRRDWTESGDRTCSAARCGRWRLLLESWGGEVDVQLYGCAYNKDTFETRYTKEDCGEDTERNKSMVKVKRQKIDA